MKKTSALLFLFLTACGTLPVKYEAQNFYRVPTTDKPKISVGNFVYVPFKDGDVAANQIHNTAMGRIYISTNVADYVKRATALELEKSGFQLADSAKNQVQADILDFTADDLGYSIDWKYKIKYRVVDTAANQIIVEKIFEADPVTTGKFGMAEDFSPSANEMILGGYDKFIRNEDVQNALLGTKPVAAAPEVVAPVAAQPTQ